MLKVSIWCKRKLPIVFLILTKRNI